MRYEMKVEQRIHPVWEEWLRIKAKADLSLAPILGKYQYIYESKKGKISLVELPDYFRDGVTLWEIMSLEGDLFDDVERFYTKEEADVQIKKYLEK